MFCTHRGPTSLCLSELCKWSQVQSLWEKLGLPTYHFRADSHVFHSGMICRKSINSSREELPQLKGGDKFNLYLHREKIINGMAYLSLKVRATSQWRKLIHTGKDLSKATECREPVPILFYPGCHMTVSPNRLTEEL